MAGRVRRQQRARELEDELALHAELLEGDLRATGMSERDARDTAHRQIGNRTRIAESSWDTLSLGSLDTFARELRVAIRGARKSAGYSLTVALTLALGIGATVTVFSVLDHVLMRPLVYSDAGRLVALYQRGTEGNQRLVSYPTLLDWAHSDAGFNAMAFVRGEGLALVTPNGPKTVGTAFVSPGFFNLMATRPALGRAFVPEEERQSGTDVVVLSHDLWIRSFGGDPHVIGRVVSLDSASPTVIGVMPPGFAYPEWAGLWRPIGQILGRDSALQHRDFHADSRAIGRLSSTVDAAHATSLLSSVQQRIGLAFPQEEGKWPRAELVPLRTEVVGDIGNALWALGGAVTLVLLIACVNLANLSAVRGASRGREMAVRLALGASRAQVARQLMVETSTMAIAGAVLGVVGARIVVGWLRATAPLDLPRAAELSIDARAVLVATLLTMTTALLFGVLPAMRAAAPRGAISALLGGRSAASGTLAQARLRRFLTGAQFCLALILLVGAGLLVQSYRRLQAVSLGFDTRDVFGLTIHPPKNRYSDAQASLDLYVRLVERLRAVAGVEEAAFVNFMPPGRAGVPTRLEIPGRPGGSDDVATYVSASDGYLRAMRIPLLRGRWFNASEMRAPGDGVVISESVAKRYWPRADAMGKSLTIFRSSQARPNFGEAVPSTVIGIVGDVRQHGLDSDPDAAVYVPMSAEPWPWGSLLVRKRPVAPAARLALISAVKEVDSTLLGTEDADVGFGSVAEGLSVALAPRRYVLSLLGAFSACALVLAAVGIYGVTSYSVAQRTQEIGIRRALGAVERTIVRTVLIREIAPALLGCAIGVASTFLIVRYVKHILTDISILDPAVLFGISALLIVVGLVACYLPARRATHIDPMIALRSD
jgi:putative ABC transport system permease protein